MAQRFYKTLHTHDLTVENDREAREACLDCVKGNVTREQNRMSTAPITTMRLKRLLKQ